MLSKALDELQAVRAKLGGVHSVMGQGQDHSMTLRSGGLQI
jgi:hypothetical protein